MSTINKTARAIGVSQLSASLGVGKTAVFNAIAKGKFPAHWARVVQGECERVGIDCPDSLFNFIAPNSNSSCPQHEVGKTQAQGNEVADEQA